MALVDYINKAFDLSRQKAVQGQGQTKDRAVSQSQRLASSKGLSLSPIFVQLANRASRNVDRDVKTKLNDLEIERNKALSSADQFDTQQSFANKQFEYTKSNDERNRDLQKKMSNEAMWGNIWGGVGNLAGTITNIATGGALK